MQSVRIWIRIQICQKCADLDPDPKLPRHILRLMACEPHQRALLDQGRNLAALIAFHREALLSTIVPLLGVVLIAVALAATGASQIAAVSLAVIASLTYPHAAVVAWMDHRQTVWRAQLRS